MLGLVVTLCLSTEASGQWVYVPAAGDPTSPGGKPNLNAPAPRNADGTPSLAGVWFRVRPSKRVNPAANNLLDFMPDGASIPIRPEAEALYQHRRDVLLSAGRPSERCLPQTIPDGMLHGDAKFKIVQTPALTLILYEQFTDFRQVFTDGRSHPNDPQPTWFGYSTGQWKGDEFVVETIGFHDKTWLDDSGHPHSDALKTTERFRRLDFGHLQLQVTIDDPKTYTGPFTLTLNLMLQTDFDLIENVCENERDSERIRAIVGEPLNTRKP
jgi:hypothetical protein